MKFGQNIAVAVTPRMFVITLRFEDAGTEIKGFPTGKLRRLRDETVPDVQVNNIKVQIVLIPAALSNGRVGFLPSQVTFFGDIQAGGLANISFLGRKVDMLNQMTNYKARIKQSIEHEVKKTIDQNLNVISAEVFREAQRRGAALGVRITGARFEGTSLVISGGLS